MTGWKPPCVDLALFVLGPIVDLSPFFGFRTDFINHSFENQARSGTHGIVIYQPNQKAHSSDEPSTIVHVYIYNYIYLLYYVQYVLYIIYTMNTHNTYLYIYSILSICISIYVHNVEFILIATPELVSTQNPTIVSNSTLGCSLPINQHVWSPPIKQHPSGQSDFLDLTTNGKPMENLSHIKSHEPHSKSHKSNFWCCCSLFGGENLLMDLDLLGGYHYELGITYYVFVHTYIYIYTANAWALPGTATTTRNASSSSSSSSPWSSSPSPSSSSSSSSSSLSSSSLNP